MKIDLRIRRQDSASQPETRRYEDFRVDAPQSSTVATALFMIQREPVTLQGQRVAPVAFESACRGDGCGACALLVGGRARLACRTPLAQPKRGPLVLEPLSKLPVVRDLVVDKSALELALLDLEAFLDPDTETPAAPSAGASFDACSRCCACLEACPSWGPGSAFVGAAALGEVHRLGQIDPAGAAVRRRAILQPGGVADCGKARNCVEVCPEELPLFDSILALNRETTRHWLRALLRR